MTHSALIPHSGFIPGLRFACTAMALLSLWGPLSSWADAQVMQPRHMASGPQSKPSATIAQAAPFTPSAQPSSLLQQPPTQAIIDASSGMLKIAADNASLTQTLQRIAEKTGMQIEGVSGDERVFGTFGPGDPRDVLNTLLHGTSYNVIMVGKLESGAPRELLLTQRPAAGTGVQVTPQQAPPPTEDDNADVPVEEGAPIPPPVRMGGRPGQDQAHSPQELLQQLREQQQLQQQQNAPQ